MEPKQIQQNNSETTPPVLLHAPTASEPKKIGEKPATDPNRDPKTGQFLPGNSANPEGRPSGSLNLSTKLKGALEKVWDGTAKETHELLIKRLLTNAVIKGDMRAIELIFDRIDGKVKEHFTGELRGFIGHGQVPEADMGDFVKDFVTNFKKKLHDTNEVLGD